MPAQTYDNIQARRATASKEAPVKSKPSSKAKKHTSTLKESPASDDEPFYDAKDTTDVELANVIKEKKTRTEHIDRRPKYTAKQGGVIKGHATNIAGVDLRALTGALAASKEKPTPQNILFLHREAIKANMEYRREFEAVQEPRRLKGNGYNVAGVGANPYGPETELPTDSDSAHSNSDCE